MTINATHINYYHVCKRKLWLFTNGINMEHTSDTVYDGKLLHETSYPQRNEKHSELNMEADYNDIGLFGKIDFYDARQKIIHETKRSDKIEKAHEWQVKFYLWLLQLNGIEGATATLEYPLLRHTEHIKFLEEDIPYLQKTAAAIVQLKELEKCPPVINAKICKSCSYYELCYVGEE
jgi:CRISPR-associated exonuclease Cas4